MFTILFTAPFHVFIKPHFHGLCIDNFEPKVESTPLTERGRLARVFLGPRVTRAKRVVCVPFTAAFACNCSL